MERQSLGNTRPNWLLSAIQEVELVVKNDVQKGGMHLNLAVIANEPELPKSVHEEAHTGTGGADHLR